MPLRLFLIGVGAGLVAAVVFASATTGPLVARMFLFALTPLPIFLAGLGVGWLAALVATISGGLLIGSVSNALVAFAFMASQGLPAATLCYLSGLSRQYSPADGGPPLQEWYPVGRLILWAAAFASVLTTMSLVAMGGDVESLRATLQQFVETVVKTELPNLPGGKQLTDADVVKMVDVLVYLMPTATAISIMGTLVFNLWLAGRITLASGHLDRPWPDIAAFTYPKGAPVALALAIAGTFIAGFPKLVSSGVMGAMFLAYVLLGLAIIHFVTRGKPWRTFALWAVYIPLFMFSSGFSFVLAMIGLAEPFLPFGRNRSGPGGGGPGPPPSNQPPGPGQGGG